MMKKRKATLTEVRDTIGRLSVRDRKKVVSILAEFPDSGLRSYDLKEELNSFQKADKSTKRRKQGLDPEAAKYLFSIKFVRNLSSIMMGGKEVLRLVFLHDQFLEGYKDHLEEKAGEKTRAYWKESITSRLPKEDLPKIEAKINEISSKVTEDLITIKTSAIAESISNNLPRMTRDFFIPLLDIGIRAAALNDHNRAVEQLARPERRYSAKELRKMITEPTWNQAKPFLDIPEGRPPISREEFMDRVFGAAWRILSSGSSLSVPQLAKSMHIDLRWLRTLMKRYGGWRNIKSEIMQQFGKDGGI